MSTGGSYRQVYVQCPFYLGDNGLHQIRCEGFGDAKFVAQVYQRKDQFRKQMESFCCDRYKNCEIFQSLMERKYSDD